MDASSSQSVSDTESIFPEIPHQPRVFHFPKREFGKKSAVRRSFQTAWFDKWPWLHYPSKRLLGASPMFLKYIIQFLARPGLPFRGHGDESESNFTQLLRLQGEDDPRIEQWIKKWTDKYTSSDIQNEILTVMAKMVLHDLTSSIQSAPFISIMIDETTDESNKEQVVICFRWVDNELDVHEDFIGLYETESTDVIALLTIIHEVLNSLNISITKLSSQCNDGASAMSGCKAGVAKLILDEEPRAIYTHCYGHSLNLACNDTIKQCAIVWEEALEYVKETDMRSRIIGIKTCMRTFDFLFGIMLGELLLRHSDNLSKTLQSPHMSAAEGQKVAAMTVKMLKSLRTDESFQAFWELVQKTANEIEVKSPSLP
eukprot:Em0003g1902a